MARRIRASTGLLAGAVLGAGAILGARWAAYAPPDRAVAARAEAGVRRGPWTHGYARVNGIRLHYAEMGTGPLVILLHGFPECWYEWRYVMIHLAERFHVVAPDLRGYNMSDKPFGVDKYTLDELALDISGLIEALGEERAHIVGHDWGGSIAWHMGMYHPERVDRLAVINAPHPAALARELRGPEQLARSAYVLFFQLPLFPEAVMRSVLRFALPATARVPGAFSKEALDVYENGISQPHAATAMINYYRAIVRDNFPSSSEPTLLIGRPTLLIWGMEDFALGSGLAEGLEEWVPDLRVVRVEECGHWVPEERPGPAADSLMRFLG